MFTSTHCNRLVSRGKLLKCLRNLIIAVYFKDRRWISKTVYCISRSRVWKIIFYSEFPDIPDKAGRKTRRRRRTQAIAKRYAFHANAIKYSFQIIVLFWCSGFRTLSQRQSIAVLNILTFRQCFLEQFLKIYYLLHLLFKIIWSKRCNMYPQRYTFFR